VLSFISARTTRYNGPRRTIRGPFSIPFVNGLVSVTPPDHRVNTAPDISEDTQPRPGPRHKHSGLWSVVVTFAPPDTGCMTTFVRPMVHDELQGVVSALCLRYPALSRSEVENVVADVYEQLAASATITAHLIPLTLNRSRRVLSEGDVSESSGHAAFA